MCQHVSFSSSSSPSSPNRPHTHTHTHTAPVEPVGFSAHALQASPCASASSVRRRQRTDTRAAATFPPPRHRPSSPPCLSSPPSSPARHGRGRRHRRSPEAPLARPQQEAAEAPRKKERETAAATFSRPCALSPSSSSRVSVWPRMLQRALACRGFPLQCAALRWTPVSAERERERKGGGFLVFNHSFSRLGSLSPSLSLSLSLSPPSLSPAV